MEQVVVERPEAGRFELALPEGVAFVHYRLDGARPVLLHTEVPEALNGRGIGSRLAQGVFDLLRGSGRKAVVRCEFLLAWLKRHPDYQDVVAG